MHNQSLAIQTWIMDSGLFTHPWCSFFKNGPISASFCIFPLFFLITISIIEKSIDGVLGNRTQGHRMVGTDETTELWRPPLVEGNSKQFGSC